MRYDCEECRECDFERQFQLYSLQLLSYFLLIVKNLIRLFSVVFVICIRGGMPFQKKNTFMNVDE